MTDPKRIVAFCDAVTELQKQAFPDLSPSDTVFALSLLNHTYLEIFSIFVQAAERKPSETAQ